jgi:two-component system, cell cycle sensor histidine kinase and response regulator CckA
VARYDLSRWFSGIGDAKRRERGHQPSQELAARVCAAVDNLPITLFEFDANGTYTCVGGGYIGLFGISPETLIGRSVFDFPKFVPGKNMMVRRALAGEAVSFSGIWPRGRFMIRLIPRFDSSGRVESVTGFGFDTGRPAAIDQHFEQLLEALRQSEVRFRAMCDGAPLGIYVCNTKLELGYVNPALCQIVRRRPDELIGRRWHVLLHAEEAARLSGDGNRLGIGVHEGVLRLARDDGSSVWTSLRMAEMRDDGEPLGYVGAVVDITQERSARFAMDRAQQDLRRVIECSPEGIAVVRGEHWVFLNRALAETLGYTHGDALIGQVAANIVHPDDRAALETLIAQPQLASDAAREIRCRRANGEYALLEIRPALLSEFDGAPALLLAAHDITDRKKLQAQLLVTERLLSMGTLAAGVAHEINNPLAAVLSNLEWVADRLKNARTQDTERAKIEAILEHLEKPIEEACDAAGRVRAIVRDLKIFSRVEEERYGAVDLTHVLDSAVRMAWNELRHRARFVRDYGELPLVHGSEARLGQVFLNLLVNAAQAIPEGRASEHEICLSAHETAAREILVEVRDSGCGIPEHIVARIFDPFFTTKPLGVGTGLGLSICQRIITSMGGQIEVASEVGRGSTFSVVLRSASSELRASVLEPFPQPMAAGPRGRVLVIDDDPAMGSAIELLLTDDHEVEVCTSARRALARLEDGASYHAIVCDVMMPEMSGMDFHAELARGRPELAAQIIFLTGGAFTLGAREFLDRIANPRLDKPFDSQSLRSLVNRQVARSQ